MAEDIIAITGQPRAGKSYFAAKIAVKARYHRPDLEIASNMPIWVDGKPVRFLRRLDDAFGLENTLVILDELHIWASSRDWQRFGTEGREWVSQACKRGCDVVYTTQAFMSIDAELRRRTSYKYWVESFRSLGFFWCTRYFQSGEGKWEKDYGYPIVYSQRIADRYPTKYEIRL